MKVDTGSGAELSVRDYSAADRDSLLSLWTCVFRETFPELGKELSDSDFAHHFDEVIVGTQQIRVAVVAETILGFASVAGETIRNLYVASGWQGCGIGTALLATVLQQDGELRLISTLELNSGARRFYEKRGFVLLRMEPDAVSGQQSCVYCLAERQR